MKLKSLDKQVVVLFGATSGIGLETALHMVEHGAHVALIGRSQEGLDDALQRVRQHTRAHHAAMSQHQGAEAFNPEDQVKGFLADATDFEQVKSAAEQIISTFGRIDTWVNLAAVTEYALFEDMGPNEFKHIIDNNLTGQAYGAMAALSYMKQQKAGALIFVSSVGGKVPLPYQAAYTAAKHGILGLADTVRMELKHSGIPVSVTTILPSSINTPL